MDIEGIRKLSLPEINKLRLFCLKMMRIYKEEPPANEKDYKNWKDQYETMKKEMQTKLDKTLFGKLIYFFYKNRM
mgnify:CR=1 FL=1